jgi:glycosyltransferase involved in cell wall biosynthesis
LGFTAFGRSRVTNFVGLAAPILTQRVGLPTIVTLHEIFEASPPRALGAVNGRITTWGARAATRLVLQADAVCVTLQRYQRELQNRYGARNVWHVPHGSFAPPEFLPLPAASAPPTLLIFATFAPYKGLAILLQAFEQLKLAYPDVQLLIAGSDHPRFPGYLTQMRASANGARGLDWLGPQTEGQLREVFARAHVVVLPYTATTGASSVLHRAAAYGRPVVASDLPDIRAVADEEGLQVVYAPPADPSALAQALARVLSNPDQRWQLAHHNLEQMQTMSLEHTCARYVKVFEEAIAGKHVS